MHKIFDNMLTDELAHFSWERKGEGISMISFIIKFQYSCTKIFDIMLTNEWKHFSRGRQKKEEKEGRDSVRQMTSPSI